MVRSFLSMVFSHSPTMYLCVAVWGSAFAGTLGRSADKLGSSSSVLLWIFRKMLGLFSGLHSLRPFAASLPNFLYGLPTQHMWCVTRSVKDAFWDSNSDEDKVDASNGAVHSLIHHTISALRNGTAPGGSSKRSTSPERLLVSQNSPILKRKSSRAGPQRTALSPSTDFSAIANAVVGPRGTYLVLFMCGLTCSSGDLSMQPNTSE